MQWKILDFRRNYFTVSIGRQHRQIFIFLSLKVEFVIIIDNISKILFSVTDFADFLKPSLAFLSLTSFRLA